MHVRKVGLGLAAAGILATTLSLSGSPAGAAPTGTLRVIGVSTEVTDDPSALGDTFAFGGNLYVRTATGRRLVGRFGVACIVTSVRREELNCNATVNVTRGRRTGQIAVQGLVGGEGDFDLAITGGTDDFENAGGTLTVHDVNDTTEILTFAFAE
jgi:hypothetical protein